MEKQTKDLSATGEELMDEEVLGSMVEELKKEAHQEEAGDKASARFKGKEIKEAGSMLCKQAAGFFHKISKAVIRGMRAVKTAIKKQDLKQVPVLLQKIKEKGRQLLQKRSSAAEQKDTLEKIKIFFVSDMDAEEAYLREMSLQGMHFIAKKGIRYLFKKGEPRNYAYHLGYYEKDKRNGERYLSNYEEAGWSSIYQEKGEFDGIWHYFRLELAEEETEVKIFSDRLSRMALYRRLLTNWQSLIVMLIVCFLMMGGLFFFILTHDAAARELILLLCSFVMVLAAAAAGLYMYIYHKISLRLDEFRYQ